MVKSKSSLSSNDLKVMHWFCQINNLRMELQAPPFTKFAFISKDTGERISRDRNELYLEYNSWKKEEDTMKAAEKRKKKRD